LARLLTLKSCGKLSESLQSFTKYLPQKYEKEVETTLSASKIPLSVGKGYSGVKQASFPNPPEWFRKISAFQSICD